LRRIIQYILYFITYLMVASLALSYLSTMIAPDKICFPAFFGLSFPYILSANIFLFIYWLIRLRKESLIILLVILLGWHNIFHFYRIPFPHKTNPAIAEKLRKGAEYISVMSFNVRSFNIYTHNSETQPKTRIFSFLNKAHPDILCLQEIYADGTRITEQEIINKLKYPYYFITYINSGNTRAHYGLAVFSLYPLLHKQIIPYPDSYNLSQLCDVIIRKDTLRVFNNHLQSTKLRKNKVG